MSNIPSSSEMEAFRRAIVQADPGLSRYNPLPRILYFDKFESTLGGWTTHIGNYSGDLDTATDPHAAEQMDHRPPMLSSLAMWDTGSVGGIDSSYAMKIATRPLKGHVAKPNKRVTIGGKGLLQIECWFAVKAEATKVDLSAGTYEMFAREGQVAQEIRGESAVHSFGFSMDLQDTEERWWPAIRYLNAENGELREKWQWHAGGIRYPYIDGWLDVEGGHQEICYNEIPTKHNWNYLRWSVDLSTREYVELQCNSRTFSLRGKKWEYKTIHKEEEKHELIYKDKTPMLPRCEGLLNCGPFLEAGENRRCFFYMDSFLMSCGW
ncbi:MAG: DUF6772 family protein [Dongiaceae bacterium]